MRPVLLALATLGCVEGGNLAVSGGAPVTAAVQGRITRCGEAVSGALVVVFVEQNRPEQSQPVNAQVGPVATTRGGQYVVELSPSFAVPGPANLELRVTAQGITQDIPGGSIELRLGVPPRDTARFDADLGQERNEC
jgi:hypothetical protein